MDDFNRKQTIECRIYLIQIKAYMKEINITLAMLIGFIVEILLFYIAGMVFAFGYPLSSGFYFILGLVMAWWVGDKIQKKAIEKYKRENEQR